MKLVVDTKKWTKPLAMAQKALVSFGKTVKKIATSWVALGSAIATGGFAVGIERSLRNTDRLVKMSRILGITAEQMAVLELSASRAGVEVNQLTTGFQQMLNRVSDAAEGTGDGVKALQQLGLSAKDMNSLSADKQFEAIAEAMEGVASQGDKMRIAMDLFGRGGAPLLNLLEDGKEGLAAAKEAARDAGLVISDKMAAGVQRAVDALGDLGAAFKGIWRQVSSNLAPLIEAVAKNINDIVAKPGRIASLGKTIAGVVVESVKFVGDSIQVMVQGVLDAMAFITKSALEITKVVTNFAVKYLGMRGEAAGAIQGGLNVARHRTARAAGQFESLGLFSDVIDKQIAGVEKAIEEGLKPTAGVPKTDPDKIGKTLMAMAKGWKIRHDMHGKVKQAPAAAAAAVNNPALLAGTMEAFKQLNVASGSSIPKQQLEENKLQTAIQEKTMELMKDVSQAWGKVAVFKIT